MTYEGSWAGGGWRGLLSEKKEGSGGRNRRRRRTKSKNGPVMKSSSTGDPEAVERALARFKQTPLPRGIPEDIDPPPIEKTLRWITNAVPKPIQKKVGEIVCQRGEFGFLPEERVDEIRGQINNFPISIEQAIVT